MPRSKLFRFDQIAQDPRVLQATHPLWDRIAGKRADEFFANQNPITLELACGYGEYTVGLAQQYLDQNYVGVDIKGERFYHGLTKADQLGLTNVGFARVIIQNIEQLFAAGEVSDIRIIHPDPRPKGSDERRRLTYRRFLDIYHRILGDEGRLRIKTDDKELFEYSLESIGADNRRELIHMTDDLYRSPLLTDHHDITTRYEARGVAAGSRICYGVRKKIMVIE